MTHDSPESWVFYCPTLRTFVLMKTYYFLLIALSCSILACGDGNANTGTSTDAQTTIEVDTTLERLNRQIEANPSDYKNYLARAEYFSQIQNYANAMRDIDRAIIADSTKSEIYLLKGDIHFKMLNEKEAYREYEHCITIDNQNTDCMLKKAAIDILLKNYDIAIKLINDALRINDGLPYAYYLKGRLYKETGDTTLACSSYQTAIEVDPTYYDAYIEAGLLFHKRKHELAKEYYRSAIDVRPGLVEPWYNLGMYLQETGYRNNKNYREAFACYDTILKLDPKFAAAQFNKGFIFLEYMQKYDSAAFHFTKAIELYPKYFQAYYNRGLAMESMNRRTEAESDYRTALNIQPDYTEAALSLDRLLKGK